MDPLEVPTWCWGFRGFLESLSSTSILEGWRRYLKYDSICKKRGLDTPFTNKKRRQAGKQHSIFLRLSRKLWKGVSHSGGWASLLSWPFLEMSSQTHLEICHYLFQMWQLSDDLMTWYILPASQYRLTISDAQTNPDGIEIRKKQLWLTCNKYVVDTVFRK